MYVLFALFFLNGEVTAQAVTSIQHKDLLGCLNEKSHHNELPQVLEFKCHYISKDEVK